MADPITITHVPEWRRRGWDAVWTSDAGAPSRGQPVTELGTPALTVRNPWAWAIAHGGKPVENRSWYMVVVHDEVAAAAADRARLAAPR
jgi:hypothetical protein